MSRLRSNQWWAKEIILGVRLAKQDPSIFDKPSNIFVTKSIILWENWNLIITQKIEDNKDNLRNMWKVLKRVINRKGKCNLVDKITVNNTDITNKQEISDEMNEYFAWLSSNLAEGIPEGADDI